MQKDRRIVRHQLVELITRIPTINMTSWMDDPPHSDEPYQVFVKEYYGSINYAIWVYRYWTINQFLSKVQKKTLKSAPYTTLMSSKLSNSLIFLVTRQS
jgi:hypothetical protein